MKTERPDLAAIKRDLGHWGGVWQKDVRALVAWVEHLEAEIAALETRLPDVISVKRRPR